MFSDVWTDHLESIIEEEELVQEHLHACVSFSSIFYKLFDLAFVHALTPGLDQLHKNASCRQDSQSFFRGIHRLSRLKNYLTNEVDELHIAVFLDVLNFESVKFFNK